MNNLQSFIDYLRTIIKVRRNFIDLHMKNLKAYELKEAFVLDGKERAYKEILKELEECELIMDQQKDK